MIWKETNLYGYVLRNRTVGWKNPTKKETKEK
jgi:hypothetical protein